MPDTTLPMPKIVFQDDHLLIVDKPSGLLTVPGKGPDKQDCLIKRILPYYPNARIVHRLDMATSGLVIIALSHSAQVAMGRLFEQRKIKKHYLAISEGLIAQSEGLIDLPLICDWPNRPKQMVDHENGKPAQTRFEVLSRSHELNQSRVALYPLTGRSHQLRVHLLAMGHVILGDGLYANGKALAASPRLMLHAQSLTFEHPLEDKTLQIESEAPF